VPEEAIVRHRYWRVDAQYPINQFAGWYFVVDEDTIGPRVQISPPGGARADIARSQRATHLSQLRSARAVDNPGAPRCLVRRAVAGLRVSVVVQLATGPEEAIGQEAKVFIFLDGLFVVAERGAEDRTFAVGVDPAHDVVLAGCWAGGSQQGRRGLWEVDRLI